MKKQKNYLKEAVVLLLAVVMISSTIAIANTNQIQPTLSTNDSGTTSSSSMCNAVAWDNGMGYQVGALAAQFWPDDIDAFPADDFELDATYDIDSVLWQGGYYNCQYAEGGKDYGFTWNITFYNHNATGNKPGSVIKEYSFDNSSIPHEFWYTTNLSQRWYANYSVTLVPPIKLLPNTRYWIGIYGYNATWPQSGWNRHNESVGGIKLHEGMFKSESFGFPDWVNTSDPSLLNMACDFNYQLGGTVIPEPILEIISIKGPIGVTAKINNTGNAIATNVTATIEATGGIILSGKSRIVSVGDLDIGEIGKAKSMIIGFGKPTIEVTVTCDEGVTANATYTPKFLLLFLFL